MRSCVRVLVCLCGRVYVAVVCLRVCVVVCLLNDVNLGCVGFELLRLLVWLFCLFVCMSVCVRSCRDIIVCSRLFWSVFLFRLSCVLFVCVLSRRCDVVLCIGGSVWAVCCGVCAFFSFSNYPFGCPFVCSRSVVQSCCRVCLCLFLRVCSCSCFRLRLCCVCDCVCVCVFVFVCVCLCVVVCVCVCRCVGPCVGASLCVLVFSL